MRAFNQREQDILKLISEIEIDTRDSFKKLLQDKYFTKDKGIILILNHITKDVLLFLKTEDFEDMAKRTKAIGELWELVSLISYLIEVRYLSRLTIQPKSYIDFMYEGFGKGITSTPEKISFIESDGTTSEIEPDKITKSDGTITFQSISLKELYETIQENIFGIVYPTEDIKSLVANKFISQDDKKHKQNISIGWTGIMIAIVLGIFGNWNPFDNQGKLEKQQFEQLLRKVDSINITNKESSEAFEKIYKELIKSDTLPR